MDAKTIVKVTNRSTARVYYTVPEMNIRREYSPKETKKVTAEEVAAVCAQPGGRKLFYNFLQVDQDNAEVLHEAANLREEPEYWLTEEAIPNWINTCTNDQFIDALKFAPIGVKDLIKKYAVSLPLNDMNKRELIKEILKFDVTAAIAAATPETKEEKLAASSSQNSTERKTTPNYKIISPKK